MLMKTVLSPDNPLGYSRAGYAWEKVPAGGEAHLDYGCYDGGFLEKLTLKGPRRLVGVDVSREAIEAGRSKRPSIEFVHIANGSELPFQDGSFDSISMLDVLEHIADQKRVLDELCRVLKPDGVLIVTVPGQYLFSCMDVGNLKFRLPRLHRWAYTLAHSREQYESRYQANPDGLVGDVGADKAWHEHFTREGLARLLAGSGFEVIDFDGSGCFRRLIHLCVLPAYRVRAVQKALAPFYGFDAKVFSSMNLFCLATKRKEPAERSGPSV